MSVEPLPVGGGMPLDPAPEQMRSMAAAVTEALAAWIGGLADAPADATEGALDVARRLAAAPPELGTGDLDALLEEALEAARHTFEYSGPGYLAYIPGGGLYTAALAEFLAQGLNRYVGLWQPSPAIVQLEENVTRWLCGLFDFPEETSQGVLTSGGSLANLSAVVTARHAKLGRDFLDGTYYVTDQAHGSNTKAAMIAGFGPDALRIVPSDAELRMDPEELGRMVRGRSRVREASVPRDRGGGHHEHRRGRSAHRDRRRRGARGSLVPRRRRLRRILPADANAGVRGSAGPSVPTASRWTRTRDCSCRTAPVA